MTPPQKPCEHCDAPFTVSRSYPQQRYCCRQCGALARQQRKYRSLADRFAEKYIPEPNSGCWLWEAATLGGRNGTGYGVIGTGRVLGETILAHRASWLIHKGDLPDDVLVRHRCDNKLCVNPDHLLLGNHKDNMRDAVERGLLLHYPPKIYEAIREKLKAGVPGTAIAETLGVSLSLVYQEKKKNFERKQQQQHEKELQASVIKTLGAALTPGWWYEVVTAPSGRNAAEFNLTGVPDLVFCWKRKWGRKKFWIELKKPKNKHGPRGTLTAKQKAMHQRIRMAGEEVAVCRSVDEVLDTLRGWGFPIEFDPPAIIYPSLAKESRLISVF